MEIEGKIIMDLPMQSGTSKAGNPWKKKEWVLETLGTYPRKVKFHIFGDKADTIRLEVGKDYVLSCDVESREFNGRWYTDVSVYAARDMMSQAPTSGQGYNQPTYGGEPQQGYGQPQGGYGQPTFGGGAAPQFTPQPGSTDEDLPF